MKATAFPKVSPVRADPCFYEIWGSFSDKGYVSRELAAWATTRQVTILRPHRQGEPTNGPHLAPSRQRIEPIFWTCKDIEAS